MSLKMKQLCERCNKAIPLKRLELVPNTELCIECQKKNDVFKWKMKQVGRDPEPTIAKTKKDWDKLKKQKVTKDI